MQLLLTNDSGHTLTGTGAGMTEIKSIMFIKINKKNFLFLLLLIILSLPAILPLLHPGFFVSDDGDWMIIRFSAFHQALVHGQFPVRFLPRLNFEYGYPVADFLYPGFMYLAEPFHILKFGFVSAIKIILGLSLVGSTAFTYLWLQKFFSKWPAFIGSLVYLYSSYHLYDIYQRGSVGEVLALAILPLILWLIERKSIFFLALSIGFLLISHNILAALFLPIIIAYLLVTSPQKNLFFSLSPLLFGIGTATFFWLPALFDLQYTVFSHTKVSEWQSYFADINLIGVSIFIIFIFAFLFVCLQIFYRHRKSDKKRAASLLHQDKLFLFFLSIGLFALFFSSSLSRSFWQFLPISFIQFPFRLLSIVILSAAFLAANVTEMLKNTYVKLSFILLVLLFIAFDIYPHFRSIQFTDKGEGFYATNEDTTTVKNEYMPKWVKVLPKKMHNVLIEGNNALIADPLSTTNKITFSVKAGDKASILINMIYFPGWQAKVDNNPVQILYNNSGGLISFPVSKGAHQVNVLFGETGIRVASDLISLMSFIILMITVFIGEKLKVKKPNTQRKTQKL